MRGRLAYVTGAGERPALLQGPESRGGSPGYDMRPGLNCCGWVGSLQVTCSCH